MEPVVERYDVMLALAMLGDIRFRLEKIVASSVETMAKRKKRTPEKIAAGEWDKLEERCAREGRQPRVPRPKKPIWG